MQMLLEGVLVGSIAFLLATFCAPAISENVADYLVGYELEQQETEKKCRTGRKNCIWKTIRKLLGCR